MNTSISNDPSFLLVRSRLPRLERSLYSYRWTPPGVDAVAVGAADFWDVPIADVTPDQRTRWKHLAFGALVGLTTRTDELVLVREALSELLTYPDKVHVIGLLRVCLERNQNEGVLTEIEWAALRDVVERSEAQLASHAHATAIFGK